MLGVVQFMFRESAGRWEEVLKMGVVVPLFKKGDRNDAGNYRGVVLLNMASRIEARLAARRLGVWSEDMGLLDDNQAGFRRGRSTVDATQMMVRVWEDVSDLRRRMEGSVVEEGKMPTATLLDLRKAYPRVNKPALWRLLKR